MNLNEWWQSQQHYADLGGDFAPGPPPNSRARAPYVGATALEVLTAPDCGAADTTAAVLAELGIASKPAFAARVGWNVNDARTCIALALAGDYHRQGQAVDAAIAQAKTHAAAPWLPAPPGMRRGEVVVWAGVLGVGIAAALAMAKK